MNDTSDGRYRDMETLIAAHHQALIGYFRLNLWCDQQRAEDAAQETWKRVIKRFHNPPDSPTRAGYNADVGAFYTWVVAGFATYIVRQLQKKKKTEVVLPPPGPGPEPPPEPVDQAPGPDEMAQIEDDLLMQTTSFRQVHRLVFHCGGYPHQQLAYGFSVCLNSHPSNRGMEGAPAQVGYQHGGTALAKLADQYVLEFVRQSGVADVHRLEADLEPLRERLQVSVRKLVRTDPASAELFKPIADREVADTCLRDYHVGPTMVGKKRVGSKRAFPAAIADWCYKVKLRVQARVSKDDDESADEATAEAAAVVPAAPPDQPLTLPVCRRCMLRHLAPCDDTAAHDE
jgi:DNA-directed RNA polymerase specialized sigma24 family protein